jgi:hypothetical protein
MPFALFLMGYLLLLFPEEDSFEDFEPEPE